jgi:hypothetical protein
MRRTLWSLLLMLVVPVGTFSAQASDTAALERGTAIIDPLALRELESSGTPGRAGFGVRAFAFGARSDTTAPILDDDLFALPAMAPLRRALDAEFDRYVARRRAELPGKSIGVGQAFDLQIFDRDLLYSANTRFVLAGIVNRMDRAYVMPDACGEIRLIYRLTRLDEGLVGEAAVSPRLPMTLNVVLPAKRASLPGGGGAALTCKDIANRWLASGSWPQTGADLAKQLVAPGGPLELIEPADVDRIETNLQIAHAPKSADSDFRTDYLFKVFRYNAEKHAFEEAPLENQIDRDRLLADDGMRTDFKAWLLDPAHFRDFDRGTLVIPDQFLAKGAVAPTPVGFAPSDLLPAYGLVQGEGANPVFTESDVVTALQRAAAHGVDMENVRSFAGFERRLNDMTCAGCHQTRGIGGFHFPGVDWMAARPSNSVVVPASPHFFGDQVRRRDILAAFSEGKRPDFSRGFSSRPQLRGSRELVGTEYVDGWGAHCYASRPQAAENDKSFRAWTCAVGLACQVSSPVTRMGMCFINGR